MSINLIKDIASLQEQIKAIYIILSERELRYDNRFADQKEAILKAEHAAEKRFESVNEFRSTLADQQNTLARKAEIDIRFKVLEEKIDLVYNMLSEQRAKLIGQNQIWSYLIGALGLAGGIITAITSIFFRK